MATGHIHKVASPREYKSETIQIIVHLFTVSKVSVKMRGGLVDLWFVYANIIFLALFILEIKKKCFTGQSYVPSILRVMYLCSPHSGFPISYL